MEPVRPHDVPDVEAFLRTADLTLSGLGSADVRLWIDRDVTGQILGSTGYELSDDGRHALVRSVAVGSAVRRAGQGTRLAGVALREAAREGATTAWLFSRRSGPFWRGLGFVPADRAALVAALPRAHQVRHFVETGQLDREVAWSRSLPRDH